METTTDVGVMRGDLSCEGGGLRPAAWHADATPDGRARVDSSGDDGSTALTPLTRARVAEPVDAADLKSAAASAACQFESGPEHRSEPEAQRPFTTWVIAGSNSCPGESVRSGKARTLPWASTRTALSARRSGSRSGRRSSSASKGATRDGSFTSLAGSRSPQAPVTPPGPTGIHSRSKPGRTERRCRERPCIRSDAAARHSGQPRSAKTTRRPLPVAGRWSSTGSGEGGVRSKPEIKGPPRRSAIAVHQKAGLPTHRSSRA